ncbi:MAG: hypothetical protein AB7V55_07220, partial [Oscillospiraceae bacterium]
MRVKSGAACTKGAPRMAVALAAVLLAVLLAPAARVAAAQADEYYMVEGIIYAEGYSAENGDAAQILRVQVVDAAQRVEQSGAEDYALVAFDEVGGIVSSVNPAVSFAPPADGGGEPAAYAVFTALLPTNEAIVGFDIITADGQLLASYFLEPMLLDIAWFDVEELEDGYQCSWDVLLSDDYDGRAITFDLLAVSLASGETNMLAYQITDTEIWVPHSYLYPNDHVTFRLMGYDGTAR